METWVVISVVIAAIAIVFQACMLTAMFLQMKRTMERVERLTDNLETRVGPILTRVQILLDDTQPKISEMVADAAHVVARASAKTGPCGERGIRPFARPTGGRGPNSHRRSGNGRGSWLTVQARHLEAGAESFRGRVGNQGRARLFALATRAGPTFLRRSRRTRRRTLHLRFRLNRASVQSHPTDFVGAGLAPPGVNLGSLQSGRSLHLLRNIISA
jgi:hypothetical protein